METFTTCTTCALVVVNGDDSVWEDMTSDERSSADAALEVIGMYDDHTIDNTGYFDCFVCDEVAIGDCHAFTTV